MMDTINEQQLPNFDAISRRNILAFPPKDDPMGLGRTRPAAFLVFLPTSAGAWIVSSHLLLDFYRLLLSVVWIVGGRPTAFRRSIFRRSGCRRRFFHTACFLMDHAE
ncbi:uncharacterized protein METZ01_LOCUS294943, partial [marine metagenome]